MASSRWIGIGGIAAAALALAACAPGAGDATGSGEQETPTEVSTDLASLGEITLTVWDQEVRGGQDEQMTRLNEAFQDAYPNITIERNSQSFDDLETTLRGALTGNDAPDVVQANNSRSVMGAFVGAGLLRGLDDYADAYGWTDRYAPSVLAMSSYSDDGTTFGEGHVYGLPQTGEVVGVFYSKSALADAGLDLATVTGSWEDFTDSLATIKDSGATPLELGNLDGWPAVHVFGPIQGQFADPQEIATLAMGNTGGTWLTDANEEAAATLQGWVEDGYFNDGPNGTDYDAAWADFSKGSAAYLIAGSWLAADLEAAMGDDVGFFAPPAPAGRDLATTGATGLPFAITANGPHADAAAGYLDFITSPDAMTILAETGNMPVNDTAALAPATGVNKDVFAAFGEVTTTGHLLPYLDWATPTMADTIGAALQDLIGEQSTPGEFLDTLEADYAAFVG
ncbi:extracellular solute-binding protein [Pseudactinotalea sp. HY160]|uniref:extracellular solute-binding protein n=1 Tax=Pseudactinotalea sp. HY160 TaxID=2654490 RepID=UPI00128D3BBD|nr:extracellular solute-binding protein [Pseudactinotalea sp. HY160]MPV49660.1 extracellular solute-binding protein [Pseudactinotalea sp. HY160]